MVGLTMLKIYARNHCDKLVRLTLTPTEIAGVRDYQGYLQAKALEGSFTCTWMEWKERAGEGKGSAPTETRR